MSESLNYFNFADSVLDVWAQQRPDATALWWVDAVTGHERRFTFRELALLSRQAANYLQSAGIRRGDRVLLILPRIPEWWLAMLGLTRLGAIPTPGTQQLTRRDIAYRIKASQATAIITDGDGTLKVSADFKGTRMMVCGSKTGWLDFDAGVQAASTQFKGEPTRADDPAIIYFTSATTGEPKMVLHTHQSYGLGHQQTGHLWLDLKPGDIHWNLSDLGWAKAAWSSFYGPWQMGACIFVLDTRGKFNPVLTLKALERYPITTWCAPPTALRLIVRENLSKFHFPHLRHCVSAGEPLNPEVISQWKTATGLTIYEAYGQTETVVLIGNFRCTGAAVKPGSMGKANPHFDIAILDNQLNELPDGQEGEIALRISPNRPLGLFKEYWQNEKENTQQFQGQWYLTGDRARRDADGYFWFIGRKDDVIKSSGYRIGPFEVENALMEHPAVLDAAVVGKPDAVRGQIVKAFVVLRPPHKPSDRLRSDIQTHCKQIVAPYKYPRDIEFVSELPKTISGKTRRAELRKRGQNQPTPPSVADSRNRAA